MLTVTRAKETCALTFLHQVLNALEIKWSQDASGKYR